MQSSQAFFYVFVALYLLHFSTEWLLDWLNLRELERNRNRIPDLYQDSFNQEEYAKSIAYTRSKTHFGWIKGIFEAVLLWALILSGAFHRADQHLSVWLPANSLWHSVVYLLGFSFLFYLLQLPFKIYFQFVLEEKFGFNRSKASTFVVDQIKSLLIALVLGVPLLLAILAIIQKAGSWWWLGAWVVVMLFQFLTAALFPVLLAPIFYKFKPLEDGELKSKINALAERIRFKMSGVFTIDGSKRSAHSNAFFAGMGRARRIVLFDTLVESLNVREIVAVLAHEMGHNKKRHIEKSLVLSALSSLLAFYALALCLQWPTFFQAFGVPEPRIAIGFLLFGLVSGVFTFPFNPLFQWISRRNEYEADRFSVEQTQDPDAMVASLVKLSKDNLSNLTPHRWYSFYHYSHPTTTERAAAIRSGA